MMDKEKDIDEENEEIECTMGYDCKCEDCTEEREFAEEYGMDRWR